MIYLKMYYKFRKNILNDGKYVSIAGLLISKPNE